MAQTEDEKKAALEQKSLFAELEKSDVKVADDKIEEMKKNITTARESAQWLGLGVHEVFVKAIDLQKASTGTLGLKVTVENEDGKNEVNFWLSPAALPYTIENISRLIVHNTAEDKKADARTFMSNITSAKEVYDIAQKRLLDGQVWLSVRESKTDTYTDKKTGEMKPSLERNLLAYKPKEDAKQIIASGEALVTQESLDEIPF